MFYDFSPINVTDPVQWIKIWRVELAIASILIENINDMRLIDEGNLRHHIEKQVKLVNPKVNFGDSCVDSYMRKLIPYLHEFIKKYDINSDMPPHEVIRPIRKVILDCFQQSAEFKIALSQHS